MTITDASVQIGQMIADARAKKGLKQREFARLFGKTQGQLSKYERGITPPPPEVLIHCMNIVGLHSQPTLSADELAKRVAERLRGDKHGAARLALAALIDQMAPKVQVPYNHY